MGDSTSLVASYSRNRTPQSSLFFFFLPLPFLPILFIGSGHLDLCSHQMQLTVPCRHAICQLGSSRPGSIAATPAPCHTHVNQLRHTLMRLQCFQSLRGICIALSRYSCPRLLLVTITNVLALYFIMLQFISSFITHLVFFCNISVPIFSDYVTTFAFSLLIQLLPTVFALLFCCLFSIDTFLLFFSFSFSKLTNLFYYYNF